jgi:AcrR family transcriptional regulator
LTAPWFALDQGLLRAFKLLIVDGTLMSKFRSHYDTFAGLFQAVLRHCGHSAAGEMRRLIAVMVGPPGHPVEDPRTPYRQIVDALFHDIQERARALKSVAEQPFVYAVMAAREYGPGLTGVKKERMDRLLDRLQQRAADMTDDKLLAELARELSRTGDAELAGTVTASAVQVLPFARSPCQEVAAPAAVAITAGARSSGKKNRNSKSTGGNGGADAGLARSDVAAQRSGSAPESGSSPSGDHPPTGRSMCTGGSACPALGTIGGCVNWHTSQTMKEKQAVMGPAWVSPSAARAIALQLKSAVPAAPAAPAAPSAPGTLTAPAAPAAPAELLPSVHAAARASQAMLYSLTHQPAPQGAAVPVNHSGFSLVAIPSPDNPSSRQGMVISGQQSSSAARPSVWSPSGADSARRALRPSLPSVQIVSALLPLRRVRHRSKHVRAVVQAHRAVLVASADRLVLAPGAALAAATPHVESRCRAVLGCPVLMAVPVRGAKATVPQRLYSRSDLHDDIARGYLRIDLAHPSW